MLIGVGLMSLGAAQAQQRLELSLDKAIEIAHWTAREFSLSEQFVLNESLFPYYNILLSF